MKKLVFLLLIVFLFSCSDNAFDKDKCLSNVRKVYPNSKIYQEPGKSYIFYVVDSTGLRVVKTLNVTNADISDIREYIYLK